METKVEKVQIVTAAKSLNESGLAASKVKVVGVSNEEMVKQFLFAVESIKPEDEEKIPDIVGDVFNSLRDEEDAGTLVIAGRTAPSGLEVEEVDGVAEEGEPGVEGATQEKINAESKTEEKPEKTKKTKEKNKNEFGHNEGSMADTIDKLLIEGTTKANAIAVLKKNHGRDEAHAASKFKAHVAYLKKEMLKNITLDETTMEYKIVPKEGKE